MKRAIIFFYLIGINKIYSQDIINPYINYNAQNFSTLDVLTPFNTNAASGPYNGEYEILLDNYPWGNPGLISGRPNNQIFDLNNYAITYQIELVSFPFSVECAFPTNANPTNGCSTLLTDRIFNVPPDNYLDPTESYWEYPGPNPPVYANKLWRLSNPELFIRNANGNTLSSDNSRGNSIVSICFGAAGFAASNRTLLPHSILKHTINIHCGPLKSDLIIGTFSFLVDLTRGRLREYPFRANNSTQSTDKQYDLLIRPILVPCTTLYDASNSNCIFSKVLLGATCNGDVDVEGINVNYTPFDQTADNLCSVSDYPNAEIGDDFSGYLGDNYNMAHIPLANYSLNISTSIRNFNGTTLAGYESYLNTPIPTMTLINSSPIVHQYNINNPIDLEKINYSEKIIYNPSEVNISTNLTFPVNYTFKTLRAIFPYESDVDAADIPENGGVFSDPTKRDVPVKTDLTREIHVDPAYDIYTNDNKLSSLYHLLSGSKLTIEPCVKIFDATFEINPGSEIVFENWLTNQINVDRYQLLFEGGIVTKRVDSKYFQNETETHKILNWEASDFIAAGENVDNTQTQGEYSVEPGADVRFTATNYVELKPGFTAKYGGDFLASIDNVSLPGCPPMRIRNPHPENANDHLGFPNEIGYFTCSPNPASDKSYLMFEIKNLSTAKISIYNSMGGLIEVIGKNSFLPPGKYSYPLPVSNLSAGLYIAKLQTGGSQKSLKFIKQ